ncbi:hypothetical protein KXD40_008005 [Peronospora effusa]|uniref:RxLR effector PexRD54 WY domain-containing protein n=1 Tax=Peronospora effusa TaxID=542832 RepID=A0A3M6VET5_9STRA|nr:hypothetical protein DD238_005234 [Peronospora effusa]RQM15086.1 hypothetical protein DD237_004415 [Peronospora effusa]UIZ23408.1 hypothetical protein KXD40_008005 [Peronospora effusa]
MSSAARISCALVVIALVICSATTVATPKSIPAGVALFTLHSSYVPTAIKRRLRRTTAMETIETAEERAPNFLVSELASSFSSLKSLPAAFYQKSQSWMLWLTRKSSDEMFKLLKLNELVKLDTDGTKLFGDPRFIEWVTYVRTTYSKRPTAAAEEILKTLIDHYGDGAALARHLVAGTDINGVKLIADLAADLQAAQLKKWDKEGKTVEEVLQILELHKPESNPFQDPLFLQLLAFVKLKHPKNHAAVTLTAFRNFYKNDAAWAKLLVAGTKTDSVKSIALNLLWLQLSRWTEGGKTVGELFTLVGLEQSGEGLFKNILFSQWATFIEVRHRDKPEAAIDVILSTLGAHYGEEKALADVLVAGTEISHMAKLAINLLKGQYQKWEDTGKSVEWIFTVLRLDEMGEGLFKSPLFSQWATFIEVRHRDKPEAATDVILSTLVAHYGEKGPLADVLVAGTEIPHMAKLAVNLLKIQFRKWNDIGKDAEWVFTILRLNEFEEELFESPRLFMWLVYVEKRYRAEDNEAYKAAIAAAEKWTDPEIKKLANEAVKTAKEVAYMEPFEAVFSTLHSHYKDDMLKEILAKGSENANPEVKKVADEVKKMHEWATQEY